MTGTMTSFLGAKQPYHESGMHDYAQAICPLGCCPCNKMTSTVSSCYGLDNCAMEIASTIMHANHCCEVVIHLLFCFHPILEILECSSNPCQNGAICFEGIGTYVCQCANGYEGANCETG